MYYPITALIFCGICRARVNTAIRNHVPMDSNEFAKPDYDGKRYSNPSSFTNWSGVPRPWDILKWKFTETDHSQVPSDEQTLNKSIPVIPLKSFESKSALFASWLGHATVLVSIEGTKVITDPVWAQRASPFSFAGPLRYRPPPIAIEDLPELHIGTISHNHYDHLDVDAVTAINKRFPSIRWFVPSGMSDWMNSQGIMNDETNRDRVIEMSWGESKELTIDGKNFKVWCIPAQHWSQRGAFDRNKALWSGWIIEGPTKKFLYTGDTGFCKEEYEKVGKQFEKIDLAAIPIGCYAPRWFMKSQHINVPEAEEIHHLIKARTSIGIHWGTYRMGSYEPYLDPKEQLDKIREEKNIEGNNFLTIPMGSIWEDRGNTTTS